MFTKEETMQVLKNEQPKLVRHDFFDGKKSYVQIWDEQKQLVEQIKEGTHPECLLFCEHEEVVTAGRRSHETNIIDQDIPVHEIERGGDVTWHGPGQLVIYPLMKLNGEVFNKGLHEFLRFWEDVLIDWLKNFDVDAGKYGPTGVWVKTPSGEIKKIASQGIAVRRWITYHGLSLNLTNDLSLFKKIRPCDFEPGIMTSLKDLTGAEISVQQAADEIEKLALSRLGL
jgi:lipoyl(octanoyl) transferase